MTTSACRESDLDFKLVPDGIYLYSEKTNDYANARFKHFRKLINNYLPLPGYSLVAIVHGEVYWRSADDEKFLPYPDIYVGEE